MDNPQFIAALATTLTAVVTLLTFLTKYAADRRAVQARQEHVGNDQAVAEFWNEWLKLQAAICAPADYELAKAQARAATAALPTYPGRDGGAAPRSALSSVLLLYRPTLRGARAAQAGFHAVALLAAGYVAVMVAEGFAAVDDPDPEGWVVVGLTLLFAAALAGVAHYLRVLSLKLETRT